MKSKKVSFIKGMQTQMRLLLKRIIDFTPPKTLSQGRARVASDIRKVLKPLDPNKIRSERIKRLIAKGDSVGIQKALDYLGFRQAVNSQRNQRGRITLKKPVYTKADEKEINAYIKKVQARVGMAKGGWAAAYAHFGGRPPRWQSTHSIPDSYKDELDDPKNPYVMFSNASPWAQGVNSVNVVKTAIRSRSRDIYTAIEKGHAFAIRSRLRKLNSAA